MGKYLVTGGCGFIGSHLCQLLVSKDHEVTVLDNLDTGKAENLAKGATLVQGCITNTDIVKELFQDIDGCFHLAAIASVERCQREWKQSHQINVGGLINLLEAARIAKTPIVYASSAAVYGDSPDLPLAENKPLKPLSAYAVDKLACEGHAQVATKHFKIPTVGLRFFNVFGRGQDPFSPYSGVLSIFNEQIRQNKSVQLYGDGSQTRDFVYVKDVVQYLLESMLRIDRLEGQVFNIASGHATSLNTLVTKLSEHYGHDPKMTYQAMRQGDIKHSIGDTLERKKAFQYQMQFDIESGLNDFLQEVTC